MNRIEHDTPADFGDFESMIEELTGETCEDMGVDDDTFYGFAEEYYD